MLKDLFIKYNSKYHYWDYEEIRQWQNIKDKGALRFILFEGLVKWGLISFSIFIALLLVILDIHCTEIPFIALVWSVAACFYGYGIWLGTHLSYKRHCNTTPSY